MKDKIYSSYEEHEDESCDKCQNDIIDDPINCFKCVWEARNAEIQELKDKVEKLGQIKILLSDLIKCAEFFSSHADCTRTLNYFKCNCSFCRDSDSKMKIIRLARQTLKEIEG